MHKTPDPNRFLRWPVRRLRQGRSAGGHARWHKAVKGGGTRNTERHFDTFRGENLNWMERSAMSNGTPRVELMSLRLASVAASTVAISPEMAFAQTLSRPQQAIAPVAAAQLIQQASVFGEHAHTEATRRTRAAIRQVLPNP